MMNEAVDDRVPVRFGPPAPEDALLVEQGVAIPTGDAVAATFRLSPGMPGHRLGCACCIPRTPAAEALARLYLARARNEVAWFRSIAVVATPAGEAAVKAALSGDQLAAPRFRLIGGP